MKKSSFLEGTFISTFGIVLCKIIGLLYVIPFYAIIGNEGGILYNYAYTIYSIFLGLSSSGIPIAISKIVSEYNALGFYNTKERAFKIGSRLLLLSGFVFFLILFIFAPQISYLIIGDVTGGNNPESITFVIRVVSTAILIVPSLSVLRGYLQGHKIMSVPSMASVLEQIVRVIVIILGSYLTLNVLGLSLETAVGVAVFGATIGAGTALLFIQYKISKNKSVLNKDAKITREEIKITEKDILKRIILYALPFILIDFFRSSYSMVDAFTVIKTLDNLGYDPTVAESALSIINTWASKINSIIISITVGMTVSLIPNIAASNIKKDYDDVNLKINQALRIMMFLVLPMTVGLHFLSHPVWTAFYGYDQFGISVLSINVFQALTYCFYAILIDINQAMNNTKYAIGTLFSSLLLKWLLNVPFMRLFNVIGVPAYYAPIITTIFIQFLAIIFLLMVLKNKYNVTYRNTVLIFIKTILATSIMYLSLKILNLFISVNTVNRLNSVIIVFTYCMFGGIIYAIAVIRSKLIKEVLGEKFLDGFISKFKIKK
mgnify:CR=1 FL=1